MDSDVLALDVAQDFLVRCGLSPEIVFGLEAVDGNGDAHERERCPGTRDRSERAGHDLHMNAALDQLRQESVDLTVANQGIPADDGEVERLVSIDQLDDPSYQFLPFVVGQATQVRRAQVVIFVSVATGAAQRAFTGDLDRKAWNTAG
jgi:hypothetical protein